MRYLARSATGDVYHVVEDDGPRTLCGVPVGEFVHHYRTGGRVRLADYWANHPSTCRNCLRLLGERWRRL